MAEPLDTLFANEPDLQKALDNYAAHASGSPSRSEVIVLIIRDWLGTNGYFRSDPMTALDREVGDFPVEISRTPDKPADDNNG